MQELAEPGAAEKPIRGREQSQSGYLLRSALWRTRYAEPYAPRPICSTTSYCSILPELLAGLWPPPNPPLLCSLCRCEKWRPRQRSEAKRGGRCSVQGGVSE